MELFSSLAVMEKQVGGWGRTHHLKIFRPQATRHPARKTATNRRANKISCAQPRAKLVRVWPTNQPVAGPEQDSKASHTHQKPATERDYARRQRVGPEAKQRSAVPQNRARLTANIVRILPEHPTFLPYRITLTGTLRIYTSIKAAGRGLKATECRTDRLSSIVTCRTDRLSSIMTTWNRTPEYVKEQRVLMGTTAVKPM